MPPGSRGEGFPGKQCEDLAQGCFPGGWAGATPIFPDLVTGGQNGQNIDLMDFSEKTQNLLNDCVCLSSEKLTRFLSCEVF